MQPKSRMPSIYTSELSSVSEDCLTLNVWAPADARNAPVFVWIHGGALTTGSSREHVSSWLPEYLRCAQPIRKRTIESA